MKRYLPDILLLTAGVLVMALLLYLGAASQGWVSLLCFVAAGVVYTGWYRMLLHFAYKVLGSGEPEDDEPFFPG